MDASLGPFVVTLEYLEHIEIGGLVGVVVSAMLTRYPSDTQKSIYATVEPYNYTVNSLKIFYSTLFNLSLILNLKNNFLSFQIWIGIIISLLTVSVCSWFILFISARFLNSQLSVERTAAKLLIYFFKVIVQQGAI